MKASILCFQRAVQYRPQNSLSHFLKHPVPLPTIISPYTEMHFISQRDSQRLKLCLCQYWSFLNKHSLGETFKLRLFKPKGFIFKHFFTFLNIFKHFKQTFAWWDFKMRIFKPKGFILPPHIFQNWQLFEYQKRIWI